LGDISGLHRRLLQPRLGLGVCPRIIELQAHGFYRFNALKRYVVEVGCRRLWPDDASAFVDTVSHEAGQCLTWLMAWRLDAVDYQTSNVRVRHDVADDLPDTTIPAWFQLLSCTLCYDQKFRSQRSGSDSAQRLQPLS